jgi:hypothetical protein
MAGLGIATRAPTQLAEPAANPLWQGRHGPRPDKIAYQPEGAGLVGSSFNRGEL